jgi:hypothetical protein
MLKTYDLVNKTSSNFRIFIFLGLSVTFLILSSIILKYNWNYLNQYIRKSNIIYTVFKITLVTQILLFSIVILLNTQIIMLHHYPTYILIISLFVSYSLSFFILFFLNYQFLRWYNIKKTTCSCFSLLLLVQYFLNRFLN